MLATSFLRTVGLCCVLLAAAAACRSAGFGGVNRVRVGIASVSDAPPVEGRTAPDPGAKVHLVSESHWIAGGEALHRQWSGAAGEARAAARAKFVAWLDARGVAPARRTPWELELQNLRHVLVAEIGDGFQCQIFSPVYRQRIEVVVPEVVR